MRIKQEEEETFEIPLIPMIDCLLVLIIYFLVATTMKKMEKEMPLQLPASAAALKKEETPQMLILGLDKAGHKYVNALPVTTEIFHQRLEEAGKGSVHPRVRIDADRDARYEDVIELVALCQFQGLQDVGLHTRDDTPGKKVK
jgi:biopolymer transport protein ExbD